LIVTSDGLPNFARLRRGASTLNARTDPDYTITLPNHTAMLTGRFVLGDGGHGWVQNDDPPEGTDLHANRGRYVASVLDVAHDHGVRTRIVAGKTKFSLYDASFDEDSGAPDTVGTDEGRDKLDAYLLAAKTEQVADAVIEQLRSNATRSFVLAHFAVTDITAHAHGWDLTPDSRYMRAVARVDVELGRILDAIEGAPSLRGRTAIVLTADHGGGAPFLSHDQPHMWVDYTIPFLVWPGAESTHDLYLLNKETRADPSIGRPLRDSPGLPPIRNGDAANLVLGLLDLPPVPGSQINARQDLRWTP
jgi:predicted AlkP superfamily pyrophosphatase or phosphodiesterase